MKSEPIKPRRNRLSNIAIEIHKVLRAAIEIDHPAGNIEIDKLALRKVLEARELGGGAEDVAAGTGDGAAAEEVRNKVWDAVGGDAGAG